MSVYRGMLNSMNNKMVKKYVSSNSSYLIMVKQYGIFNVFGGVIKIRKNTGRYE